MSEREKKLLTLFAIAGVIIFGFWGFKTFTSYKQELQGKLATAKANLESAEMFAASRESIADEITWLAQHEPEPRVTELAGSALEKLADSEATRSGMVIKSRKILTTIEAGTENGPAIYSIAQAQFQVTGTEQKLYDWFDRMHNPDEFRIISDINMLPNKEDDTLIDCTVTYDLWFLPTTVTAETETEPAP